MNVEAWCDFEVFVVGVKIGDWRLECSDGVIGDQGGAESVAPEELRGSRLPRSSAVPVSHAGRE